MIKDLKKLHRFKLYQQLKNNGKVCLLNKYHNYAFLIVEGRLFINADLVQNYKSIINDLISYDNNSKGYYINREIKNEYERFERCKNRIDNMFIDSKNLFFLTFTISNKYYDDMYENQENFQRKIKKFLNDLNCIDWCFNLDFGSNNGRLHAHAIISHNNSTFDLQDLQKKWKIGNIDVAKTYNDNSYALEKYLSKFTNHSFKNTTMCRVQYSRNKETSSRYCNYNIKKGVANKYN